MGSSQQLKTYEWPAEALTVLRLQLPYTSSITLENSTDNTLYLSYSTEGEYDRALQLQHRITENQLHILEQGFPGFQLPNDKLAAHKVFAASLQLKIPKHMTLDVQLHEGQLIAQGSYRNFKLNQKKGRCELFQWNTPSYLQLDAVAVVLRDPKVSVLFSSQNTQETISCGISSGPTLKIDTQNGSLDCAPQ